MRLSFLVVTIDSVTFVSCVFDSFVPLSFTLLQVLTAVVVLVFSVVYLDFFALFASISPLVLIQEVPIYASLLKQFIKQSHLIHFTARFLQYTNNQQGFLSNLTPFHINLSKDISIYLIKQMKPNFKKTEGNKLIAIVGDEDTVTGFLLTGIGERNVRGETNYLIVDEKSTKQSVETVFNRFLKDANISVVLVTQEVSDRFLRETITQREEIYPVILEIPSKQKPYDPVKDVVMQRAHRLLYGSQLSENS